MVKRYSEGKSFSDPIIYDNWTQLRSWSRPDGTAFVILYEDIYWGRWGDKHRTTICRFDHGQGHDLYDEGLHIDVNQQDSEGGETHHELDCSPTRDPLGLYDYLLAFLREKPNRDYLYDVYSGKIGFDKHRFAALLDP